MERGTIVILLISMLAKVNWAVSWICREKTRIRIFGTQLVYAANGNLESKI